MESAKKEEMANGEPALAPPATIYPIAALSFREAKTMPEAPHECVVRTPENEAAYVCATLGDRDFWTGVEARRRVQ
jgi:hypothetical protein